jgi:exo-beta-1,3-glucanase (GH17 family)
VEGSVSCKTQDQANAEFAKIASQQFTNVRVYGTPCNQIEIAIIAAKALGLNLMTGIFDMQNVSAEVGKLIRQVKAAGGDTNANWAMVDTITIGNEDVKGLANPTDVINAIAAAHTVLNGTGFQGAVIHVDTIGAIIRHPQLCSDDAGDYIAANIHPFFNPSTPAIMAGKFVAQQVELLRRCSELQSKKRSNHRVVVTETSWPTRGDGNGQAVPGRTQQFAAIASIQQTVPTDVYLYSAFNNIWLVNNAGTFNAEHFWGILDN